MITLNLTAGASSDPLAITLANNTNNDCSLASNIVSVKTPGVYEICGAVTLTSASAVSTGVGVYANDTLIGNDSVFTPETATETTTLPLYATVEVEAGTPGTYVEITLQPTGSPTIVSGFVSIKKLV